MPVAKSKNKFRMQPNFQSFCLFPEGILISSLPGLLIFYSVVSFINIEGDQKVILQKFICENPLKSASSAFDFKRIITFWTAPH